MYMFQIPKMSCGGCANSITKAIKDVDGDAKIQIDLKSKTVEIESSASQVIIVKALTDSGYTPA